MQLSDIVSTLERYRGVTPATAPPTIEQDFENVAQNAPPEHIAEGLSDAFRSNETPAFGSMLANLYGRSNGDQKAGILNQLLNSAGPSLLSSGLLSGALGGLSNMLTSRSAPVSAAEADRVPPEAVEQIATHAEKQNPSIVDQASSFYAQHPTLVQALGAGSLALIMSHMSRR